MSCPPGIFPPRPTSAPSSLPRRFRRLLYKSFRISTSPTKDDIFSSPFYSIFSSRAYHGPASANNNFFTQSDSSPRPPVDSVSSAVIPLKHRVKKYKTEQISPLVDYLNLLVKRKRNGQELWHVYKELNGRGIQGKRAISNELHIDILRRMPIPRYNDLVESGKKTTIESILESKGYKIFSSSQNQLIHSRVKGLEMLARYILLLRRIEALGITLLHKDYAAIARNFSQIGYGPGAIKIFSIYLRQNRIVPKASTRSLSTFYYHIMTSLRKWHKLCKDSGLDNNGQVTNEVIPVAIQILHACRHLTSPSFDSDGIVKEATEIFANSGEMKDFIDILGTYFNINFEFLDQSSVFAKSPSRSYPVSREMVLMLIEVLGQRNDLSKMISVFETFSNPLPIDKNDKNSAVSDNLFASEYPTYFPIHKSVIRTALKQSQFFIATHYLKQLIEDSSRRIEGALQSFQKSLESKDQKYGAARNKHDPSFYRKDPVSDTIKHVFMYFRTLKASPHTNHVKALDRIAENAINLMSRDLEKIEAFARTVPPELYKSTIGRKLMYNAVSLAREISNCRETSLEMKKYIEHRDEIQQEKVARRLANIATPRYLLKREDAEDEVRYTVDNLAVYRGN